MRSLRLDPLEPCDANVLLAQACQLRLVLSAGKGSKLLRGKNLGLLCETEDADDAILFRLAAQELGAHVAHIRPSLSGLHSPGLLRYTTRMLGRLYDAVECQGLSPELVRQVGEEAGVPVYDGLGSATHPTARLVEPFDPGRPRGESRRLLVQAALMCTLL